jgi:transposase-like protein
MREAALNQLQFQDADVTRKHLEAMRWTDGATCPHCDSKDVYTVTAKAGSNKPVCKGVYKCAECREQFTVTIGTIFEDSKVPLNKWLLALHLLCASKKGMSSHQLHRMLGVAYKTAWFMSHRIRYAVSDPSPLKLKGVIEADETYVGGVQKFGRGRKINQNKRPVFSIVKRGGEVRSFHVANVTADTLGTIIKQHVDRCAHLCTDEFGSYQSVGDIFAAHKTAKHSAGEYVRGYAHVNSAEGFFSLLRSPIGLRLRATASAGSPTLRCARNRSGGCCSPYSSASSVSSAVQAVAVGLSGY